MYTDFSRWRKTELKIWRPKIGLYKLMKNHCHSYDLDSLNNKSIADADDAGLGKTFFQFGLVLFQAGGRPVSLLA